MKSLTRKRKVGASLGMALAGLVLLSLLMGNAATVLAADVGSDGTDYTDQVELTAENNYGADLLIPVEMIPQYPALPNGCEVTALAMLLRQAGFGIDQVTLSNYFLPKEPFRKEIPAEGKEPVYYCGDPEKVYCGEPSSKEDGFYCLQGPIIETARLFFEEQGSPLTAVDLSGAPESGLVGMLNQGTPVMVWCTLTMDSLRYSTKKSWIISGTETEFVPYSNLHTMVLVGYNDENFYLNDPLNGLITCPRETFMNVFQQLGSRAVAIL